MVWRINGQRPFFRYNPLLYQPCRFREFFEIERLMKIYTRTGDQGSTSLIGNERVKKSDLRINAYGTIDELNAILGIARSLKLSSQLDEILVRIQNQLFDMGAELASSDPASLSTSFLTEEMVHQQEQVIDQLESELSALKNFILPGGTQTAAVVHLARCVCRRAEREIVALAETVPIREVLIQYVNRLSDLLFVVARSANAEAGENDVPWIKDR